jgi:hypothetical protein
LRDQPKVQKYFVGQKALGFDIEWKPNFTSGEDNDTAVIQLSSTQVNRKFAEVK